MGRGGQPRLSRAGMTVYVYGIRHHGPGSARAVLAALAAAPPDLVLVEGPPELDTLVPLVASKDLVPPVAALVHRVDDPKRAAFYPMAAFSPEWVALRWAARRRVPARFLDLPAANSLAAGADRDAGRRDPAQRDPISELAAAAGYDDAERWWEDAVEHRGQGAVFASVLEAMAQLRTTEDDDPSTLLREAAMRRVLRAAAKEGHERIAVVCGAWHAPALVPERFPSASADAVLLRGLPKAKVAATWVPWTSTRLARATGYGAGVTSPGWYAHLFTVPDDAVAVRWLVRVAGLLRDQGLAPSSANVIEAVRLAEALAALRGRPLAGLEELTEATQAVLCAGSAVPLATIERKLLVGEDLGSVPDETPMVPLARDLAAAQKRLRLPPSAEVKELLLDLRTPAGLGRSVLLHRLLALGVPWGQPAVAGRTTGTFREAWVLQWEPELSVALVEASGAGNTIAEAAAATVRQRAADAADMATLTALVEASLPADLPDAVAAVVEAVASRAAHSHDVPSLMTAVEPLARTRRYGDVRGFDTQVVASVLAGILTRVVVGLPAAAASLDDDAAQALAERIDAVQRSIGLVDPRALPACGLFEGDEARRLSWFDALRAVADRPSVHGLWPAGRCGSCWTPGSLVLTTQGGGCPAPCRERRTTARERPGSRASWSATRRCCCTTRTCSACWTGGWPRFPTTCSTTCCRSCAGRSRRSPRWSGDSSGGTW